MIAETMTWARQKIAPFGPQTSPPNNSSVGEALQAGVIIERNFTPVRQPKRRRPPGRSSETVNGNRQYREHLRTGQHEGLLKDFEAVAVSEPEPSVGAHLPRKGLLSRTR
jgi:hypothetical protein